MKTTKQTLLTIIICLAILAGVNLVYGAWSNPPYQGVCNDPPCPPGGNTPEPINVGDSVQTFSGTKTLKMGSDGLSALGINGSLQINGLFKLPTGAGDGKVLKSDSSGVATWDTDTDTKCNTSGSCSQVCIGSDCKSSWPSGGYVSGGLYGYGVVDSLGSGGCTGVKLPMTGSCCAPASPCACPSGFTRIVNGKIGCGPFGNQSCETYSCYKN